MEVSVVLPVYNSATTISSLAASIVAVLEPVAAKFELILVNDGSIDASWFAVKELAKLNPSIVPINLSRNYGEHNATLCGI
ncbi:MAG: glycosyltransferase, partial [Terriglobales bacterium]